MADELLTSLEQTRDGYGVELCWHRFLLDSYSGGGGYQGSIKQPDVGWWGAEASRYAQSTSIASDAVTIPDTYLDRYAREDEPKFTSRISVAHLWNFVGPLTDLKLSYLLRKGLSYAGQPPDLADWREDIDGRGTTWDETRPLVALLAAIYGWTPVVVDMTPATEGESVAQARARGAGRPRAIVLTPSNLVDYSHDGDRFVWAKIRTDHVEKGAWNAKPVKVSTYRIWTSDSVSTYDVREGDKGKSVEFRGESPHPFGQVPLAIFQHQAAPGESVVGLPMHAAAARAQKRLYNLLSELDEHMRSQVFAVLVVACKGDPGPLTLGVDNALPLDKDGQQKHYYMSPEGSIAETYERRIEATIREGIYRASRVEFANAKTQAATSGVARAYAFAETNRGIADSGACLARGEEWLDSIVWAGLGKSPEALDGYAISAAQDYGIEDLAAEIEHTVTSLALDLGATMTKRLKLRLAERLDPQMPPDVRALVEADLDAIAEQAEIDAAMMREMRDATEDPELGDEDDDDDSDEDEEAAA